VRRRRIIRITAESASSPNNEPAATIVNSAVVPIAMVVGYDSSYRDAGPKRDERCHRVIDVGRWRRINDDRIVHRHIDHLRIGRHDLHDRIGHVDDLSLVSALHHGIGDDDHLLGRRLKRSC
jgi:hypothetical protein